MILKRYSFDQISVQEIKNYNNPKSKEKIDEIYFYRKRFLFKLGNNQLADWSDPEFCKQYE